MKLLVLSCHYHIANLSTREKVAFATPSLVQAAYERWTQVHPDTEIVLLSTCNRVELYVAAEDDAAVTGDQLVSFLATFHHLPKDFVHASTVLREGTNVAKHLFRVTCSLDSIAIGETQIVAQAKAAYNTAIEADSCGPVLHALFQRALAVSAKVRTKTRLSKGRVSIASVAIGSSVKTVFSQLSHRTAVVIGAGEMAAETLHHLRANGIGRVVVLNRSPDKAAVLAKKFGAETAGLDDINDWLGHTDVVVTATSSTDVLIDRTRLDLARTANTAQPLVLVDLAAPRNIDCDTASCLGVSLFNLDDLGSSSQIDSASRSEDLAAATEIVEEGAKQFQKLLYHRKSAGVIRTLKNQIDEIATRELQSLFRKSARFDATQVAEIEDAVTRVVNKMLHSPFSKIKQAAADGVPSKLLNSLEVLFELPT